MKIAVIGGNLTGCASAWYLEKSHEEHKTEYDRKVKQMRNDSEALPEPPEKFKVKIFEKRGSLGGYKFQTDYVGGVPVECGKYSSLHADAVFVNSAIADFRNELELDRYWLKGNSDRVVRSFAILDWVHNSYSFRHAGYFLVDLLRRIFRNGLVRFLLFNVLVLLAYYAAFFEKGLKRLEIIFFVLMAMFSLVLFPTLVLSNLNNYLGFWSSTILGFLSYGSTIPTSRGAAKGFVEHFKNILKANATTNSITVRHLLNRCGLGSYSTTDAATTFKNFHFFPEYVKHFVDARIRADYASSNESSSSMSALSAMLCMQRGDLADGEKHFRIKGGNAKLCECLAKGSEQMLNATVVKVVYNRREELVKGKKKYTLFYKVPAQEELVEEMFDGIVLSATPTPNEIVFECPGVDSRSTFGYNPDYMRKDERSNKARWLALVLGKVNHGYFGHRLALTLPDLITSFNAPSWTMLERVAETANGPVWALHCQNQPRDGDELISEMFTEVIEMKVHERQAPRYLCKPIPATNAGDDLPQVVIGNKFIYAAAIDRLSCDPETDLMAARNAASLFSPAVNWKDEDEDEENGDLNRE